MGGGERGVVMYITRDTLTHIKGAILKAIISGKWDKCLPREYDGRVFTDLNFTWF